MNESYNHDFIITFAEASYNIGKGKIKTKEEMRKFLESSMPPGTDISKIRDLILWSLQDVLEDDKNLLYDDDINFPGWEIIKEER